MSDLFAGHQGYVTMLVDLADSGRWPRDKTAEELQVLARQALKLGLRAMREARRLKKLDPT